MNKAPALTVVMLFALACTEFLNSPTRSVTVRPASTSWTREWFVRDSDTLVIEVRLPDSTEVAGVNVEWESNDSAVLEVTEASRGGSREDSLTVQLKAKAVAHSRGIARITVGVNTGGAFTAFELVDTIRVKEKWIAVSAGSNHSCAVSVAQRLFCWGYGATGALGDGSAAQSNAPAAVVGVGTLTASSVSAGAENSCASFLDGVLSCWGLGTYGRLGNGSELNQFFPVAVSLGRLFQSFSAGTHTCGIADGFIAFCWGNGQFGQLGAFKSQFFPLDRCFDGSACSLKPIPVRSAAAETLFFRAVDVGSIHTCGIAKSPGVDGPAMCWGKSPDPIVPGDTAFVLGDSTFQRDNPGFVAGTLRFTSISAGGQHTCALTSNGAAYCWGGNKRGQLGLGTTTNQAKPQAVVTPLRFASITVGDSHTCALTELGVAYCWGANDFGQLGIASSSPGPITSPSIVARGLTFSQISAGDFHSCGITTAGGAYCWGRASHSELAADSAQLATCVVATIAISCSRSPVRVSEPVGGLLPTPASLNGVRRRTTPSPPRKRGAKP